MQFTCHLSLLLLTRSLQLHPLVVEESHHPSLWWRQMQWAMHSRGPLRARCNADCCCHCKQSSMLSCCVHLKWGHRNLYPAVKALASMAADTCALAFACTRWLDCATVVVFLRPTLPLSWPMGLPPMGSFVCTS